MAKSKTRRAYGWKPSLPDIRDREADLNGMIALEEVDPREDMPAPYDQGQLGSCTGNAIAGAKEYDDILNGEHSGTPSRLFIYYEERVREGTVSTDSGAYGRDGFASLRKTGAPPEDLWPYDIDRFTEKPPEEAFKAAKDHRIKWYIHPGLGHDVSLIQRQDAFKRVLSNRQTIAFGFTVYSSFESEWDEPGRMPMPQEGESILGGHEVLLIGYLKGDDGYALVRNSWGTNWGLDGYFFMPWKFLVNPRYCGDWRSIYRPI